jgi:hypothetical protein
MGRDVQSASLLGIPAKKVEQRVEWVPDSCPTLFQTRENLMVHDDDANNLGEIIRRPVADHVGFACADTSPEQDLGVKALVMDVCRRLQGRGIGAFTKAPGLLSIDEC